MRLNRPFKMFVSLVTSIVFLTTSLGISPGALAAPVTPEVSLPYQATIDRDLRLAIPQELGKLEHFTAGISGKPAIFHIQTAHGHYEAQQQIRQILHYLDKQYGVTTVLVEGSAFQLDPKLLNFFPKDPKLTQKVNEELTKRALVKGPELYLLDKLHQGSGLGTSSSGLDKVKNQNDDRVPSDESRAGVATAFGIENLGSYRENGLAFADVLSQKEKTSRFLSDMDLQIERLASHILSKDLRDFLRRVEGFEANKVPLDVWLRDLKGEAQKHLEIDLASSAQQLDRPMLVRFYKLHELWTKFDSQKFPDERKAFLNALRRLLANDKHLYEEIEQLLTSDSVSRQLPDSETELLFEDMAKRLPENFNYEAFPSVRLFIGALLLQSELKADRLLKEVQSLSLAITERMVRNKAEKQLIAMLADYRLLQKLFALELMPEDYDGILARSVESEGNLKPSMIAKRFLLIGEQQTSPEERAPSPIKRVMTIQFSHVDALDALYEKAMQFYAGVKERDGAMEARIEERLRQTGASKVAVITGGFHSQPFEDYFSAKHCTYALISPKLSLADSAGHVAYEQNALRFLDIGGRRAEGVKNDAPSSILHPAIAAQSAATRELEFLTDPQVLAGSYAINAAAMRSEIRKVILEVAGREAVRDEAREQPSIRTVADIFELAKKRDLNALHALVLIAQYYGGSFDSSMTMKQYFVQHSGFGDKPTKTAAKLIFRFLGRTNNTATVPKSFLRMVDKTFKAQSPESFKELADEVRNDPDAFVQEPAIRDLMLDFFTTSARSFDGRISSISNEMTALLKLTAEKNVQGSLPARSEVRSSGPWIRRAVLTVILAAVFGLAGCASQSPGTLGEQRIPSPGLTPDQIRKSMEVRPPVKPKDIKPVLPGPRTGVPPAPSIPTIPPIKPPSRSEVRGKELSVDDLHRIALPIFTEFEKENGLSLRSIPRFISAQSRLAINILVEHETTREGASAAPSEAIRKIRTVFGRIQAEVLKEFEGYTARIEQLDSPASESLQGATLVFLEFLKNSVSLGEVPHRSEIRSGLTVWDIVLGGIVGLGMPILVLMFNPFSQKSEQITPEIGKPPIEQKLAVSPQVLDEQRSQAVEAAVQASRQGQFVTVMWSANSAVEWKGARPEQLESQTGKITLRKGRVLLTTQDGQMFSVPLTSVRDILIVETPASKPNRSEVRRAEDPEGEGVWRMQARFARSAKVLNVFALGIALAGFAGWILDLDILKGIFPSMNAMKMNTAIGLALAAAALGVHQWIKVENGLRRILVRSLAVLVFLMGALSLGEYHGWALGDFDMSSFKDAAATIHSAGISWYSAVNFALLGVTFFLLEAKIMIRSAVLQVLAFAVTVLSWLGLSGYLHQLPFTHPQFPHTAPMAFHSAAAFFLIGYSILFYTAGEALMKPVSSLTFGGKMLRRILPAVIYLPILLNQVIMHAGKYGSWNPDFFGVCLAVAFGGILSVFVYFLGTRLVAEETSQKKEAESHRAILQVAMDGFWALDTAGRVIDVNEAYCRMSGYSRAELLTMDAAQLEANENHEELVRHVREILDNGEARFPSRHRRKDGSVYDVEIRAQRKPDGSGQIFAFIHDVTERKKTEKALQESETKFREMAALSPALLCRTDLQGRITYGNEAAFKKFGYTSEDMRVGLSIFQMLVPGDRGKARLRIQERLRKGRNEDDPAGIEYTALRKDGTTFSILVHVAIDFRDGKPAGLMCVITDISELKTVEKAMVASEQKFKEMVVMSPAIFFATDKKGRFLEVSDVGLKQLGYTQEAVKRGLTVGEMIVPEDRKRGTRVMVEILRKGISSDDPVSTEYTALRADGTTFPVLVNMAVRWEEGKPSGFWGVMVDMTRQKASEAKLREHHALLSDFAEHAPGALYQFKLSPDGRFSLPFANVNFVQSFGIDPKDLREDATAIFSAMHPEDRQSVIDSIQESARTLGAWNHEFRVVLPDGEVQWRSGRSRPKKMEDGSIVWHGFVQDITKRKKAEEELKESQALLAHQDRLATVGTFIAGLTHELNNPLAIMEGYGEQLGKALARGAKEEAEEHLRTIQEHLRRSHKIIQDLLRSVRANGTSVNRSVFSLEQAVQAAVDANAPVLRSSQVDVFHAIDPSLMVFGDEDRMVQVFMNLIKNAVDAPKGDEDKQITITGRKGTAKEGAEVIKITVHDNGLGADSAAKWFDPYFTTKARGYGTGLGLPLVKSFVEEAGGTIEVATAVGQGATFTIVLPRATQTEIEASARETKSTVEEIAGGEVRQIHKILVVEDIEVIGKLYMKHLSDAGYEVVWASDGAKALQLLDRPEHLKTPFDMVITDFSMPNMHGDLFALAFRDREHTAQRDKTPIVLMTGFNAGKEYEAALKLMGRGVLDGVRSKDIRSGPLRDLVGEMKRMVLSPLDKSILSEKGSPIVKVSAGGAVPVDGATTAAVPSWVLMDSQLRHDINNALTPFTAIPIIKIPGAEKEVNDAHALVDSMLQRFRGVESVTRSANPGSAQEAAELLKNVIFECEGILNSGERVVAIFQAAEHYPVAEGSIGFVRGIYAAQEWLRELIQPFLEEARQRQSEWGAPKSEVPVPGSIPPVVSPDPASAHLIRILFADDEDVIRVMFPTLLKMVNGEGPWQLEIDAVESAEEALREVEAKGVSYYDSVILDNGFGSKGQMTGMQLGEKLKTEKVYNGLLILASGASHKGSEQWFDTELHKPFAGEDLRKRILDPLAAKKERQLATAAEQSRSEVRLEEPLLLPVKDVVHIAFESADFFGKGGLKDVVRDNPPALLKHMGATQTVIMPGHPSVFGQGKNAPKYKVEDAGFTLTFPIEGRMETFEVFTANADGVRYYFIKKDGYFLNGYRSPNSPEAFREYAVFARAAVELLRKKFAEKKPDDIHLHDAHPALAAPFMRTAFSQEFQTSGIVTTIHNADPAYQQRFSPELFQYGKSLLMSMGMPEWVFGWQYLEFHGGLNLMKAGLVFSEKFTAVSPGYHRELLEDPDTGLRDIFRLRQNDFTGILNGLSGDIWNPATSKNVYVPYDSETVEDGKRQNKLPFQKEAGLDQDEDAILVVAITRLADQKGPELILEEARRLLKRHPNVQFAIMGEENEYATGFRDLMKKYPGRAYFTAKFGEVFAQKVLAAGDLFLMPSKYEPCGLSQLQALRYGVVPIGHGVGGIDSTIIDPSEDPTNATGYKFYYPGLKKIKNLRQSPDFEKVMARFDKAVERAIWLKEEDAKAFNAMRVRGMRSVRDWDAFVPDYKKLYSAARVNAFRLHHIPVPGIARSEVRETTEKALARIQTELAAWLDQAYWGRHQDEVSRSGLIVEPHGKVFVRENGTPHIPVAREAALTVAILSQHREIFNAEEHPEVLQTSFWARYYRLLEQKNLFENVALFLDAESWGELVVVAEELDAYIAGSPDTPETRKFVYDLLTLIFQSYNEQLPDSKQIHLIFAFASSLNNAIFGIHEGGHGEILIDYWDPETHARHEGQAWGGFSADEDWGRSTAGVLTLSTIEQASQRSEVREITGEGVEENIGAWRRLRRLGSLGALIVGGPMLVVLWKLDIQGVLRVLLRMTLSSHEWISSRAKKALAKNPSGLIWVLEKPDLEGALFDAAAALALSGKEVTQIILVNVLGAVLRRDVRELPKFREAFHDVWGRVRTEEVEFIEHFIQLLIDAQEKRQTKKGPSAKGWSRRQARIELLETALQPLSDRLSQESVQRSESRSRPRTAPDGTAKNAESGEATVRAEARLGKTGGTEASFRDIGSEYAAWFNAARKEALASQRFLRTVRADAEFAGAWAVSIFEWLLAFYGTNYIDEIIRLLGALSSGFQSGEIPAIPEMTGRTFWERVLLGVLQGHPSEKKIIALTLGILFRKAPPPVPADIRSDQGTGEVARGSEKDGSNGRSEARGQLPDDGRQMAEGAKTGTPSTILHSLSAAKAARAEVHSNLADPSTSRPAADDIRRAEVRTADSFEVAPADISQLQEVLALHNEKWGANKNKFMVFPEKVMRDLIQKGLVYLLRDKEGERTVRGVLLTYPVQTGGDMKEIQEIPLWKNMTEGRVAEGPKDTVFFWGISVADSRAVSGVNAGQVFASLAAEHFLKDFRYVRTFSPVLEKDYAGFVNKMEQEGLAADVIKRLGVYLYLVSSPREGPWGYIDHIYRNGFIAPDDFFKATRRRYRDPAEHFHVGKNGAKILGVLPQKKGFTRPDGPFTAIYGYGPGESDENFRKLSDVSSPIWTHLVLNSANGFGSATKTEKLKELVWQWSFYGVWAAGLQGLSVLGRLGGLSAQKKLLELTYSRRAIVRWRAAETLAKDPQVLTALLGEKDLADRSFDMAAALLLPQIFSDPEVKGRVLEGLRSRNSRKLQRLSLALRSIWPRIPETEKALWEEALGWQGPEVLTGLDMPQISEGDGLGARSEMRDQVSPGHFEPGSLTVDDIFKMAKRQNHQALSFMVHIAELYGGSITPEMRGFFEQAKTADVFDLGPQASAVLEALERPGNTATVPPAFLSAVDKILGAQSVTGFWALAGDIKADPVRFVQDPIRYDIMKGFFTRATNASSETIQGAAEQVLALLEKTAADLASSSEESSAQRSEMREMLGFGERTFFVGGWVLLLVGVPLAIILWRWGSRKVLEMRLQMASGSNLWLKERATAALSKNPSALLVLLDDRNLEDEVFDVAASLAISGNEAGRPVLEKVLGALSHRDVTNLPLLRAALETVWWRLSRGDRKDFFLTYAQGLLDTEKERQKNLVAGSLEQPRSRARVRLLEEVVTNVTRAAQVRFEFAYVIKSGDTVYHLSRRFGLKTDDLVEQNGWASVVPKLSAGDVIHVATWAKRFEWIVEPGQTVLARIASKFDVTAEDLIAENPDVIRNAHMELTPGTHIWISRSEVRTRRGVASDGTAKDTQRGKVVVRAGKLAEGDDVRNARVFFGAATEVQALSKEALRDVFKTMSVREVGEMFRRMNRVKVGAMFQAMSQEKIRVMFEAMDERKIGAMFKVMDKPKIARMFGAMDQGKIVAMFQAMSPHKIAAMFGEMDVLAIDAWAQAMDTEKIEAMFLQVDKDGIGAMTRAMPWNGVFAMLGAMDRMKIDKMFRAIDKEKVGAMFGAIEKRGIVSIFNEVSSVQIGAMVNAMNEEKIDAMFEAIGVSKAQAVFEVMEVRWVRGLLDKMGDHKIRAMLQVLRRLGLDDSLWNRFPRDVLRRIHGMADEPASNESRRAEVREQVTIPISDEALENGKAQATVQGITVRIGGNYHGEGPSVTLFAKSPKGFTSDILGIRASFEGPGVTTGDSIWVGKNEAVPIPGTPGTDLWVRLISGKVGGSVTLEIVSLSELQAGGLDGLGKVGPYSRIAPEDFQRENVVLENGAQILRVPKGSRLTRVTLRGGASYQSIFADVRGGVAKFASDRSGAPLVISDVEIPSSYTLMDRQTLEQTRERNHGVTIPFVTIRGQSEPIFLVHSSYCHPDELILPQGVFTKTSFQATGIDFKGHRIFERGTLYLDEKALTKEGRQVQEGALARKSKVDLPQSCDRVIIKLGEGGFILRQPSPNESRSELRSNFVNPSSLRQVTREIRRAEVRELSLPQAIDEISVERVTRWFRDGVLPLWIVLAVSREKALELMARLGIHQDETVRLADRLSREDWRTLKAMSGRSLAISSKRADEVLSGGTVFIDVEGLVQFAQNDGAGFMSMLRELAAERSSHPMVDKPLATAGDEGVRQLLLRTLLNRRAGVSLEKAELERLMDQVVDIHPVKGDQVATINELAAAKAGGMVTLLSSEQMLAGLKGGANYAFKSRLSKDDAGVVWRALLGRMRVLAAQIADASIVDQDMLLKSFNSNKLGGIRSVHGGFVFDDILALVQGFLAQERAVGQSA